MEIIKTKKSHLIITTSCLQTMSLLMNSTTKWVKSCRVKAHGGTRFTSRSTVSSTPWEILSTECHSPLLNNLCFYYWIKIHYYWHSCLFFLYCLSLFFILTQPRGVFYQNHSFFLFIISIIFITQPRKKTTQKTLRPLRSLVRISTARADAHNTIASLPAFKLRLQKN